MLEIGKLSPGQFVTVLETLHMLGTAGAGVELSSLSTPRLVDIVHKASREQVAALAEHEELRAVFLHEIFRRMGEQLVPERARNVSFVVSWRFPRPGAAEEYDRYQLLIEDGECTSGPDLGLTPDTTITLGVDDFIRMATGVAAVAPMFVTGKVKVKGEYAPAVRLSSYFDMPTPN
ncbi:sterol-binding protein [Amycolatopsis antarctica]|uniref:Sterol-binding protein n=1 Tax=Amycolatopsis antarctica TaxID=1854586 RepID=A0A263D3R9_9PSEU|nr:SCP2 sterol-binding domain-containing protein [Amycolatopsis antarctica]OZM72859.1 sterol-binding protein [Amycolatopsis antarctica]